MAYISLDFLHNYSTGERRESDPEAYQYDEGHVLEAVVPVAVTSCEIQYWIRGMEKADAYTPTSITQNTDNTYTILGNIPNSYFETNGDLRVYIVVTDGDASITTYEGYIHIKERQMPEDYVDDDPDNEAVRVIAEARAAATTATEKAGEAAESAQQAQEILDSIPEDYTELTEEVSNLKDEINYIASEANVITSQYVDGGYINTNVSIGATVNLVPVSSVQRKWIIVSCKEGDVFTITGVGGENPRLWAFTDADYKLISVSSIGAQATNLDLTAPQEGYFISDVDKSMPYALSHTHIYKALSDSEAEAKITASVETFKHDTLGYQLANLFDKGNIESGKYVNPSNGQLASGASFFASDFIEVSNCDTIKASKTHIVAYYDENKNFVSAPTEMDSLTKDITLDVDGVSYLRFSSYNQYLNEAQIGENVSSSDYKPFGVYTLKKLAYASPQIIVDVNGDGDYTSFTKAVYDNIDNGVEILVKAGTYNIVTEYEALFGAENVASMADSDSSIFNGFQYGIILRNRKVEFAPGAHIVCDWSGHTVDGTHRFSALRVDYNVEIVGLDLVSTHTFYAIHDDYGVSSNPYTVVYENCRVKGVNLTNANCIGGGCKPYSRHIINNCYFDNGVNDTVVRYHNTNAVGAEPEVYVSNSFFNSKLSFNYYGSQTTKMKAYVNNCKASTIVKEQESSSFGVDNVELYKWCCEETAG